MELQCYLYQYLKKIQVLKVVIFTVNLLGRSSDIDDIPIAFCRCGFGLLIR